MKTERFIAFSLGCAVLLTGCATRQEAIEKRIGQKADFFTTLPPEKQSQLREGNVGAGDTTDAAWIVYGPPDRVLQRVTGTATNEVWSYVAFDATFIDSPRSVYYPVRNSRGQTIWRRDMTWATDVYHHPYEYLRIEFQNGHIFSLESEKPYP